MIYNCLIYIACAKANIQCPNYTKKGKNALNVTDPNRIQDVLLI